MSLDINHRKEQQGKDASKSMNHCLSAAVLFLRWLDKGSYWGITLVMGMMVIIVSVQVVLRYLFGASIDSADELARLFFVWTIFLAIPHGIRHGAHVGIDLVISKLPSVVEEQLFRIMSLVSMFLMIMLMMGAWQAIVDRWPELMPTLPITSAVFYIVLLICAVHSILHLAVLVCGGSKVWEVLP